MPVLEATAIETALSTAFASVQTDATSYVTLGLPYALGIMAMVLGISIAVKVFKRFAKQLIPDIFMRYTHFKPVGPYVAFGLVFYEVEKMKRLRKSIFTIIAISITLLCSIYPRYYVYASEPASQVITIIIIFKI